MQTSVRGPLRGSTYVLITLFVFLFSTPVLAEDCSKKTGLSYATCEIGNIWSKVKDIAGKVGVWTTTKANETWEWTEKTWKEVEVAGEETLAGLTRATNDTVNTIDTTLSSMSATAQETTEEILARIQVGIKDIQFHVEYEAAELMDFIGGTPDGCSDECKTFRKDVLAFIQQAQDLSNTLITFRGTGQEFAGSVDLNLIPPVDYTGLNELISSAPGSTLYPMYRTFKALDQVGAGPDSILAAVTDVMYLTDTTVQQLQDAVRAPAVYVWAEEPAMGVMSLQSDKAIDRKIKLAAEDPETPATFCMWLQQDYEPVEGATVRHVYDAVLPWVQGSGLLLKVIGNSGDAISHGWEMHAAASAGWVAEGEVHIKGNRARMLFKFLAAVGEYALDVAALASSDLTSCDTQIIHYNTQLMHAKQDYIVCILESDKGGARAVDDCQYLKNW